MNWLRRIFAAFTFALPDFHYGKDEASGEGRPMEPIDARRMFPGFDEPGFKTPFTVMVTAPKDLKVFANAPLVEATPAGAMTTHRFATTEPLPTYLVALGVGAFERVLGVKPLLVRTGGTLPIVPALANKGIATVITGFALPESNVHSPNEKFLLRYFDQGVDTAAALFTDYKDLPVD